jgi:hypothetical protein
MKEAVQNKYIELRALLAFFVLSMLLVHDASAQRKQDFTHNKSLTPTQCGNNQLSLRHEDEDAAMGGLRNMKFIFTNISASPCTLEGYPRFELLNKLGQPVRGGRATNGLTRMGDDLKKPPQLVTIEPGKTAMFWIGYLARGAGSIGKPCPTYRKFKVTAPGTNRVFIQSNSYVIEVCSGLEVSPVLAPSNE